MFIILPINDLAMTFKIVDVKGDGNCFYRCIWNIVKDHEVAKEDFMLVDDKNEDDGCLEIRYYVATEIKFKQYAQDMLMNIIELDAVVDGLSELYPFLLEPKYIRAKDDSISNVITSVCDIIKYTTTMASELETTIISSTLTQYSDICLLILTQNCNEVEGDMIKDLLYQVQKMLPKITTTDIAIIINIDNIHYKYVTFMDKVIFTKCEINDYIITWLS